MIDLTRGETARILAACDRHKVSPQQRAYILATAWWETNRTMLPVREGYYLGTRAEAFRRSLRYWPWYGRGFVQLTWEANYRKAGPLVGADLIADPDRAMDPEIAAEILVRGSMEGWFTGKSLRAYIDAGRCDYVEARRVINGLDCARQIAALADEFEDALSPAPDYPLLRRGARGAFVRQLQDALVAHGQHPGTPDGIFGRQTEDALRRFQTTEGLTADGIAGPKTWARLMTFDD